VSAKGRSRARTSAEAHSAEVSPSRDAIAALIRGTWVDPDSGEAIRVPVASIVVENSLRDCEKDLVDALGFGRRVAVVCDPATHAALGARVQAALDADCVVLDAHPHADMATVKRVRETTAGCDALIAVGSGTINDLCKYAAAASGKPYAVFATAPSMNGYTSVNATITVGGHKNTLPAAAPRGVFVDLDVLARAPLRMIRAGIGDSICRPTAQLDWRLSHLLLGTRYREAPFALLAPDEPAWLDAPEAVVGGNLEAMRALVRTLLLSGLGMTICGGSSPASQGEHLVSHFIDMFAPPTRGDYLHGEQVAVATLAVARLQERALQVEAPAIPPSEESEDASITRFGEELGESCWKQFAAKAWNAQQAASLTRRLAQVWDTLRSEAARIALPASRIDDVLRRAGAPRTPSQIGVDDAFFARAMREARFLRDRYTFLDLAADAGLVA
jgi:glycerol-1-phosphate dehydrogenase [NAD(P)+]